MRTLLRSKRIAGLRNKGKLRPLNILRRRKTLEIVENRQSVLVARLTQYLVIAVMLGQILIVAILHELFDDLLEREIYGQAFQNSLQLKSTLDYAVNVGAEMRELPDLENFIFSVLSNSDSLGIVRILDSQQNEIASASKIAEDITAPDFSLPIGDNPDFPQGTVQIWVNNGLVDDFLLNAQYEFGFILLVFFIICQEIVGAMISVYVTTPLYVVSRLLARIRNADFSTISKHFNSIEMNTIVRKINLRVRQLNQRFFDFRNELEERAPYLEFEKYRATEYKYQQIANKYRFVKPSDERELSSASPGAVRIPCFLFFFANELPTGFLPIFLNDLETTWLTGLPESILISLPFLAFFIALSIGVTISGSFVDKLSEKLTFIIGIVPALIGYIGLVFANTIEAAIVARAITGFGYGLIFIAGQNYIIRHAISSATRTRDVSVFSKVVMTAILAGPALGSLLVEHVGFDAVFIFSAACALLAGITATILFSNEDEYAQDQNEIHRSFLQIWIGLLTDRYFFALSVLVAIPTKLALTSLIFYLVPLTLDASGETAGFIGRVILVYGLAFLLFTPVIAKAADERTSPTTFLVFGGLISGAGMLIPLNFESVWGIVAMLTVLGIGHSMLLSQQLVVLREKVVLRRHGLTHAKVVSRFRQVERAGTIVGFIVFPILSNEYGYITTISILGGFVFVLTILFAGVMLFDKKPAQNA